MRSKNQVRRERKKAKRSLEAGAGSTADHTGSADTRNIPEAPVSETDGDRLNSKKSGLTMLARKYEWLSKDDPLYSLKEKIDSRFKRNWTEADLEDRDEETTFAGRSPQEDPSSDSGSPRADTGTSAGMSRKQQKAAMKPSLADLKRSTSKPELVEWHDADAAHPEFLVFMKTLPHAVPVPSNWQSRSEIPKFGPKPGYKLPQNIVETGIQDAWKGERLDVDYEKLHAAFFSPDAPKPKLLLLPHGQVVDLKLRKAYKPDAEKSAAPTRPLHMSQRLRTALGLGKADPLPWEAAMKTLGDAPGYANATDPGAAAKDRWGFIQA